MLNYMEFADEKLSDEENRAKKYLDFTLEESNTKVIFFFCFIVFILFFS